MMKEVIMRRLSECKLKLNEEKTRIVYCKDNNRREEHEIISFDFLGYTFRPRKTKNNKSGSIFTGFLPAVSQKSKNHIHETIGSWQLHLRHRLIDLDTPMEAPVRGWLNYYGKFSRSILKSTLQALNHAIVRWAVRRFKRFKGSFKRAWLWLIRCYRSKPGLFYHWRCGIIPCYHKLKPAKIRRAV